MYLVTILNYRMGKVDAITNVPDEICEDNDVEEYLSNIGYPVNDCSWICIKKDEDYEGAGEILGYTDEEHMPYYIDAMNF